MLVSDPRPRVWRWKCSLRLKDLPQVRHRNLRAGSEAGGSEGPGAAAMLVQRWQRRVRKEGGGWRRREEEEERGRGGEGMRGTGRKVGGGGRRRCPAYPAPRLCWRRAVAAVAWGQTWRPRACASCGQSTSAAPHRRDGRTPRLQIMDQECTRPGAWIAAQPGPVKRLVIDHHGRPRVPRRWCRHRPPALPGHGLRRVGAVPGRTSGAAPASRRAPAPPARLAPPLAPSSSTRARAATGRRHATLAGTAVCPGHVARRCCPPARAVRPGRSHRTERGQLCGQRRARDRLRPRIGQQKGAFPPPCLRFRAV